jgi:hypothetical protein
MPVFTAGLVFAQSDGTKQRGELMPLESGGAGEPGIKERLGPESDVLVRRSKDGSHELIFRSRADAERAWLLWHNEDYSLLELYVEFGGSAATAPKDFLWRHEDDTGTRSEGQNSGTRLLGTSGGGVDYDIPDVFNYGGPDYEDTCMDIGQYSTEYDNCPYLGTIRIGLIATAFNWCHPEGNEGHEPTLEQWSTALSSHFLPPFDGITFPAGFDELGDQGIFGSGAAQGEKNITILPTRSGGILVCGVLEHVQQSLSIEEELFPGAWFLLWEDESFLPSYVLGVAFQENPDDSGFMHQRIRARVRYPQGVPEADVGFFWAATY